MVLYDYAPSFTQDVEDVDSEWINPSSERVVRHPLAKTAVKELTDMINGYKKDFTKASLSDVKLFERETVKTTYNTKFSAFVDTNLHNLRKTPAFKEFALFLGRNHESIRFRYPKEFPLYSEPWSKPDRNPIPYEMSVSITAALTGAMVVPTGGRILLFGLAGLGIGRLIYHGMCALDNYWWKDKGDKSFLYSIEDYVNGFFINPD